MTCTSVSSLCISWGLVLNKVPHPFAWFSLTQIIIFICLNHWWSPSVVGPLLKVFSPKKGEEEEKKKKNAASFDSFCLWLKKKNINVLTVLPSFMFWWYSKSCCMPIYNKNKVLVWGHLVPFPPVFSTVNKENCFFCLSNLFFWLQLMV